MDTILAATPNPNLVSELAVPRGKRQRRVIPVGSAEDLERALSSGPPSLVVVDARLPSSWEIVRRLKVDGRNGECRTPVLFLESEAPEPFLILPDARLAPSSDAARLSLACDELLDRHERARRIYTQDVAIEMVTTPDSIERASDIFAALVATAGYSDTDQVALETTFREALGNAAEHGNKHDQRKKIRVLYLRDREKIAFVVSDEGPGFDHRKFLARADEVSALEHTRSRRASEARPGGLGVFIMKKTCDAIGFNDNGTSIYLMKYLPGAKK
jgi:anti-sigma regulatory factor (Ser/Thr protein kinase)